MTIHLFILPALVSAAMYTRVKQGGAPAHQRISYEDLYAQVSFLSQLFRGEFIFPTEGLATNLDKTLQSLEADRVITVTREDERVVWVELSDAERECGRENYDFYCFMIWPFVEASWLGAVSLMMLTPPPGTPGSPWLDVKKVQDRAQLVSLPFFFASRRAFGCSGTNGGIARQDAVPPRRPLLLRGRQQGDAEERVHALRGGGHRQGVQVARQPRAADAAPERRVDARKGRGRRHSGRRQALGFRGDDQPEPQGGEEQAGWRDGAE